MGDVYTIPDHGPWTETGDFIWIQIEAFKLGGQSANARSAKPVNATSIQTFFKFLAPPDISFVTDHSWDDYQNMTSRLSNIMSNYLIFGEDVSGATKNLWSALGSGFSGLFGGGEKGKGMLQGSIGGMESALGKLANVDVAYYRIDAPLVYSGSSRVEYMFNFELATHGKPGILVEVLQKLRELSSPRTEAGNFLKIEPPHVFKISSLPSPFIFIEYAALKSIQSDVGFPYRDGLPQTMKLTLTFQDITPLFDTKFTNSVSRITTGTIGQKFREILPKVM